MDASDTSPDRASDGEGPERDESVTVEGRTEEPQRAEPQVEEPPRPTIAASAVRAATRSADVAAREADGDPATHGLPGDGAQSDGAQSDGAQSDGAPSDVADDVSDVAAGEAAVVAAVTDVQSPESSATVAGAESDDGAGADQPTAPDEPDENLEAWRSIPLATRIEALLFAATDPVPLRRLQSLAGDVDAGDVRDAIDSLQAHYIASARAFGIQEIGGGYQLRTDAALSEVLSRLGRKTSTDKLSPAAIETLAIVAYRQPVLRVDVEKIRGVASGEVLRTLVEKGVVRVAGRADLPGSPLLYGTTAAFLEIFGLRDLRDLPSDRELLRG